MTGKPMRCKNCRWWDLVDHNCHRHPPFIESVQTPEGKPIDYAIFPPSRPDDWCGEFEPRPESTER